jgi:pimeloyl-ACP methyl ester carboxylesterase
MPVVSLDYQLVGQGRPLVMLMGTGSPGRVWRLHQTPALTAAGFACVLVDNRGIGTSADSTAGMTIDDMAGDTAALIEHLGIGPAAVVGTSLGARVAQELALARPDLVSRLVLMATHGRRHPLAAAITAGRCALHDAGVVLPESYHAAVEAALNLSPASLADPAAARDWLDVIGFSGSRITAGVRAQLAVLDGADRLAAYAAITAPALVIGFADDRVLPPVLAREVAAAIPGARYAEVPDAGHWGYLEQPRLVNELIVQFLTEEATGGSGVVGSGGRAARS